MAQINESDNSVNDMGNPYVDLMLEAKERLIAGSCNVEAFKRFIVEKKNFFLKAKAELDENYKEEFAKEIESLKKAYDYHNEGIDVLESYCLSGSTEDLERGINIVTEAAQQIKKGLANLAISTLTASPTKSPHANILISACKAYQQGKLDNDGLGQALEYFTGIYRQIRSDFENVTTVSTDSVRIQEELPTMMQALDRFEEAILEIENFFQDGESSRIDNAIALLKSASDAVDKSQQVFEQIAETEGKVLCVKCQHYNSQFNALCEKCGAKIPRIAGTDLSSFQMTDDAPEESGQQVMTENLKKLYEAVNAIAERQISDDEYVNVLNWMVNLLNMAEKQLAEVSSINPEMAPPEQREAAKQEAEIVDETKNTLVEGFTEFRRGLDMLRSYLDTRNREDLVEGIRVTYGAAQQIYAVQIIGEMAQRSEVDAEVFDERVKRDDESNEVTEVSGLKKPDEDRTDLIGSQIASDTEGIISRAALKGKAD